MKPTTVSNQPSANTKSFTESLRLLHTRRFGTFGFASPLSNLGTWAQQVAEPWLLLSLGAVGCFALNALSYVPFIWVALWILPRGKRAARTSIKRPKARPAWRR